MTEPTPDAAPDQAAQPAPDAQTTDDQPADTTDWKAEARKWETRAKDNQKAARELEQQRQASMSEAEKAVAEAEKRGESTATARFGTRLARTQWEAEAARRNPGYDAVGALEDINLAKFIGEDGEPDAKAIAASVARLVPEASNGTPPPPSFDGGTRQPATTGVGMSQLIRKAAGRA
jgi:hypothetical protein